MNKPQRKRPSKTEAGPANFSHVTSHELADKFRGKAEFDLNQVTEDVGNSNSNEGREETSELTTTHQGPIENEVVEPKKITKERNINSKSKTSPQKNARIPTISHTIRFKEPTKLRLALASRFLEQSQDSIANEAIEKWLAKNGYTEKWYQTVVATLPK